MRNLKRALSLALASIMLLGMMVVGSSAKGIDDFSDSADIVNQDAVAVTSAIGMFAGYEDGTFKPENVVTRAEMAVIITTMLYGAGFNAEQFAGTQVFTDVPAWAEGYVNLCSSLGIVAGVGDGKFDPNATVTTAQAVLMLCRALGYFQNAKDFGSDWMLAATAKGTQLGLYGNLKLAANAGLKRDDVAELVFNALTVTVPVQYNELLGVYYNENQGITYSLSFNYLETLGYKNFDLVYKTKSETMYGRPAITWGIGSYNTTTNQTSGNRYDQNLDGNGGLINSYVRMLDKDEIITVAMTPDYVYTKNTNEGDIYKDLGASVCVMADADHTDGYSWTAYVNGEKQDANVDSSNKFTNGTSTDGKLRIPTRNNSSTYTYTGKGAVTEIYVDDFDQTVTVVEINYYIGEVSTVKTDSNGEYITVKPISSEPKLNDRTFHIEGYEEEDYVVFTVDMDDDEDFVIGEIIEPTTATGKVTRVDKDNSSDSTYVRLEDGTKYTYSGDKHIVYDLDERNVPKHPDLNEVYTLYLDPNGYVLGYILGSEAETRYLYVQDSDEELKEWVAKVSLADATTSKVDVNEDLKKASDDKIKWLSNVYKTDTNIDELIWKYNVSDAGLYTLTYVSKITTDTTYQATMADAEIHNGKAYVSDGTAQFIVDKKTVFVDVDGKVAYTGYNEVPNVENAKLAYVVENKVASVVFILDGTIYADDSTYFFLASDSRATLKYDGDFYWEYDKAYVDGKQQTVTVDYDACSDSNYLVYEKVDGVSHLLPGVLYQAKKTVDDKYITEVVPYPISYSTANAVGDDAFWVTTISQKEYKYDVDNDTVFVTVEVEKGKFTVSEGGMKDMRDETDYTTYVEVIKSDKETAELVYIYRFEDALKVDVKRGLGVDFQDPKPADNTFKNLALGNTIPNIKLSGVTNNYLVASGNLVADGAYTVNFPNGRTGSVTLTGGAGDVTWTNGGDKVTARDLAAGKVDLTTFTLSAAAVTVGVKAPVAGKPLDTAITATGAKITVDGWYDGAGKAGGDAENGKVYTLKFTLDRDMTADKVTVAGAAVSKDSKGVFTATFPKTDLAVKVTVTDNADQYGYSFKSADKTSVKDGDTVEIKLNSLGLLDAASYTVKYKVNGGNVQTAAATAVGRELTFTTTAVTANDTKFEVEVTEVVGLANATISVNANSAAAPVTGQPLSNVALFDGTGATGTFTWDPAGSTAIGGKVYKLVATLTADDGYVMPATATGLAQIGGVDGVYKKVSDTAATITYTFDKTDVLINEINIETDNKILVVGGTIGSASVTTENVTGVVLTWHKSSVSGGLVGAGATVAKGATYFLAIDNSNIGTADGYAMASDYAVKVNGKTVGTVSDGVGFVAAEEITEVALADATSVIKGGQDKLDGTTKVLVADSSCAPASSVDSITLSGDGMGNEYSSDNLIEGNTYNYKVTVEPKAKFAFIDVAEVTVDVTATTGATLTISGKSIDADGNLTFTLTFTATAP